MQVCPSTRSIKATCEEYVYMLCVRVYVCVLKTNINKHACVFAFWSTRLGSNAYNSLLVLLALKVTHECVYNPALPQPPPPSPQVGVLVGDMRANALAIVFLSAGANVMIESGAPGLQAHWRNAEHGIGLLLADGR